MSTKENAWLCINTLRTFSIKLRLNSNSIPRVQASKGKIERQGIQTVSNKGAEND